MKFVKSTIITFLSNVLIFGISVISTVVTSRLLGPEGKGILSISNNIVSIFIVILGFGVASSNVYFIGKDRKKMNNILSINLLVAAFSAFVLLLLYIVNIKYPINILFKGLDNNIIIIVLITIPFMNLKAALINVLLGMQEIGNYNKVNIYDNLITLIMLVVFILVYKTPYWVVISGLVSVVCILIILTYMIFFKVKFKFCLDKSLFENMFRYGIKAQVASAVQILNYRLSFFIINYFLGVKQVGIYSNAVVLGETMWKVSGSVSTVVLPMTSNSKDKESMKLFINKVTRITFALILICSVGLIIVSKPLILLLLGRQFVDSVEPLILLIPGISIFSISNILASYFAGIGMIEKNMIASIASCICTVGLNLILVPKMGINGASIATSIAYIVATIITVYYYIKITKSNIKELLFITKSDYKEIVTAVKKKLKR